MSARALRPSVWLVPLSAALIYFVCLSALLLLTEEEGEPALVVAFFAFSLLAGLVIKRFSALVLPLGVVAVSLLWESEIDETPVVAMIVGRFAGILLARGYERLQRGESFAAAAPASRSRSLAGALHAAKRIVTRERVDNVLDHARFRLDTFPHGVYHPVASLPGKSAKRGAGSESRWEAMFPIVRERGVETAVDIGTCEGYFAIHFGQAGIPTIAIEGDPTAYRTAIFAVRRSGLANVGVLAMHLTPENIVSVPAADCTLCLSVWHHFVRHYGLGDATEMLETIWERTDKVLFFDTGEDEMTPDFRLPAMTPEPRSWLAAYLAEACEGSRIEHLGLHAAFDPAGRPVERNLFAIIRV